MLQKPSSYVSLNFFMQVLFSLSDNNHNSYSLFILIHKFKVFSNYVSSQMGSIKHLKQFSFSLNFGFTMIRYLSTLHSISLISNIWFYFIHQFKSIFYHYALIAINVVIYNDIHLNSWLYLNNCSQLLLN